jgi:hypothetical protein
VDDSPRTQACAGGRSVNRFIRFLLAAILFPLYLDQAGTAPAAVHASHATFHVAQVGQDKPDCGSEGSPCQTIQYALSVAGSGDEILVAAGTYTYSSVTDTCSSVIGTTAVVCVLNKELAILGGFTTSNWTTPDPSANATIIDGQSTWRGVLVQRTGPDKPTTSLRMEGFTIQNGLAQGAPGGEDQATLAFGGGMLTDASKVVLKDMVFRNNRAIGGNIGSGYGGAGSGGGLALRTAPHGTTMEQVVFAGNEARGGTGSTRGGLAVGGGLYTYETIVSGGHLVFANNIAIAGSSPGDGLGGSLTADAHGGGAAFQVGSDVTLQYVTATNNLSGGGDASTHAGGGFGGAIKTEKSTVRLSDASLTENQALGGNGAHGGLGCGGGLETSNSDVTLNRVHLLNNRATGGNGSALGGAAGGGGASLADFGGDSLVSISNTVVANNLAEMGTGTPPGGGGGGLWLQGTHAEITHTTVAGNRLGSLPMQGQGILVLNDGAPMASQAFIHYTIIADHTTGAGKATSHAQQENAITTKGANDVQIFSALHVKNGNGATLERTLWANNDDDNNAGEYGAGEIDDRNPLHASLAGFASPGAPGYDYHLLGTSAAIDQAIGSAMYKDIDCEGRPSMDGYDIGADEYMQPNIVLHVSVPTGGALRLTWQANPSVMASLDHFNLLVTCEPGASPPREGDCGVPLDVGKQTDYTFSGLTSGQPYTARVKALGASGAVITTSNTVIGVPLDIIATIFLPMISR